MTLGAIPAATLLLQWGHVSRTWKTWREMYEGVQNALASMGPRLKDVEDVSSRHERLVIVVLQWGHVSRTWKTGTSCHGAEPSQRASMGPRLKDVEDDVNKWKLESNLKLQWGHVSRTWKTRGVELFGPALSGFNGATSQGRGRRVSPFERPLGHQCFNGATSQGRGRLADQHPAHHCLQSFNGATSQGRGRLAAHSWTSATTNPLQWGHVSRTWKTAVSELEFRPQDGLQWGHVSRTWKTSITHNQRFSPRCFNGATSQGRGRLGTLGVDAFRSISFNGATSQGRGRPAA